VSTIAADCQPAWKFDTLTPGVLSVAAINGMPKLLVSEGEGAGDGIDGKLIDDFAAEACLTVEWHPLTGAAALQNIQDGRVDMLGGVLIKTPPRAEVMNLTTGFYVHEAVGITSKDEVKTVDQLQGKTVGVQAGAFFVPALQAAIGADNVKEYQTSDATFKDLEAGRIDAVAATSLEGNYYVSSHPDAGFKSGPLADDPKYADLTKLYDVTWGTRLGHDDVTSAVDSFYTQAREDGTIAKVVESFGLDSNFYVEGTR
jgi:ABC-type amino acid transport substrate-binding protein